MIVIKVSGHELDDPQFLGGLCDAIAGLGRRALLVHGGGKEITAALRVMTASAASSAAAATAVRRARLPPSSTVWASRASRS
jgi:acetylglutamate kinase